MNIVPNADTWIASEEIGSRMPPYQVTYEVNPGTVYVNDTHKALATAPVGANGLIDLGIPGWLRPADALKLYELTYYSSGSILELGSYQGLSTTILAQAVRDTGAAQPLLSIDLNPSSVEAARRHLRKRGLARYATVEVEEALAHCTALVECGRQFAFLFVDHSHAYQDMLAICRLLPRLISPDGFCLFHDYNDARNNDLENSLYGVSRAVRDALDEHEFAFYGIFGCTGLYRRNH